MASWIIVPTVDELCRTQLKNVACPAEGCDRIFSQETSLRLHLIKVHRIIEGDQDLALLTRSRRTGQAAENKRYHCPVEGCKYNSLLGRSFTSMALLKQHYIHVHAEKKFKCGRCGTGYAQQRDLARHEKNCQLMFVCAKCKKIYNSREALLTHCRREGHKSNFEGINREAFGTEEPVKVTEATTRCVSSSDNPSTQVRQIGTSQPQKLLFQPGNIHKSTATSNTNSSSLKTIYLTRKDGGLNRSSHVAGPVNVRLINHPTHARSLLKSCFTNSVPGGSTVLLETPAKNAVRMIDTISGTESSTPECLKKSVVNSSEISNSDFQGPSYTVSSMDTGNSQDDNSSKAKCVKDSATPRNEQQTNLSLPTFADISCNIPVVPKSDVSHTVSNDGTASQIGTVAKPTVTTVYDPKSLVMDLLRSDLFKNWSSYVKTGVDPSIAFQTATHSVNRPSLQLNVEPQEKTTSMTSSARNDLPEKMMNDIQSLQMKTDFLSLIQGSDIGCTESSVKEQVSELLKNMKYELTKLQNSCKTLVSTTASSNSKIIQVPASGQKMPCNTLNFPSSVIRPKSKLLLPKPSVLMLPVNIKSNGSIGAGQQEPLMFICDTGSVPLKRNTLPKPIKPKPTFTSTRSKLSTTATMTDRAASRVQAQDTEIQTDCASFTSRGVGTNLAGTVVGSQTQAEGGNAFAVGSQTYDVDLSEQRGVHIGIQTSMTKDKAASGTQTSEQAVKAVSNICVENFSKSIQVSPRKRSHASTRKGSAGKLLDSEDKILKSKRRKKKAHSESHVEVREIPVSREVQSDILPEDYVSGNLNLIPPVSSFTHQRVGSNRVTPDTDDSLNGVNAPREAAKAARLIPHQRRGGALNKDRTQSPSIATETRIVDSTTRPPSNINVRTMPTSSFLSEPDLDMSTGSFSTQGTDPLPGYSGDQLDDNDSLSLFSSQYTQTSLWKALEDSIMAESNATQTMESFLSDASLQNSSLTIPTFMESGVQASSAQHSQTQTLGDDIPLSHSKSVGVGTSLLDDTSPLLEGMEPEGFSRSVGIDTQLFDDLFPEVSSRSVAISTPLFDGHNNPPSEVASVRTSTFQTIDQTSVSVGVSPPRPDFPVNSLPTCDQSQNTNLSGNSFGASAPTGNRFGASAPTLRYESIATASVQTDTDRELRCFLTSGSQTTDFDTSYINMETQTVDQMFNQLLSNMETQTTTDAFLAGLDFVDIETQTSRPNHDSANVETQTSQLSSGANRLFPSVSSSTTSSLPDYCVRPSTSTRGASVSIDTETQTLLPNLHITENCFTDSHTQTTLNEFESLVEQLEKN